MSDPNLSSFLWSVADLLRGDYKQSEYGKVILPFTVLRRLDCVLEPTKPAVLAELALRQRAGLNPEPFLLRTSKQHFYNTSPLDLKRLMGDQDHIGEHLRGYIDGFSPAVRDIFLRFDFHAQITRLDNAHLLYVMTEKFAAIDLHPNVVSNAQMGAVFEELIRRFAEEAEEQGFNGRFGPGLPRVSDGSLLFLLHLLSKMRPAAGGGSRFAIVLNGSPLFTGGGGAGESEIRRYVLEKDLLEAIVALPTDMFYNTGISTYVWVVSNRKPAARKGKVQLIDASRFWRKMRKSLGSKRKELSPAHIEDITRIFGGFEEVMGDGVRISRIFPGRAQMRVRDRNPFACL